MKFRESYGSWLRSKMNWPQSIILSEQKLNEFVGELYAATSSRSRKSKQLPSAVIQTKRGAAKAPLTSSFYLSAGVPPQIHSHLTMTCWKCGRAKLSFCATKLVSRDWCK